MDLMRLADIHDFIDAPRNGSLRKALCGQWVEQREIEQARREHWPVTCPRCRTEREYHDRLEIA